jgi:hypothetical protein
LRYAVSDAVDTSFEDFVELRNDVAIVREAFEQLDLRVSLLEGERE